MHDRLKAEMKKQGISGNRLAIEAKIATADFYTAINGKKPFYPNWRKRVADVLGVDEAVLFDDDNERGKHEH